MEKMKITLSPIAKAYWIDVNHRFSMQSIEKFISYFFDDINISIKDHDCGDYIEYDGIIYHIQDDETHDGKLNIMLCIENCMHYQHYKHFNKFQAYNNPDIKIYLYGFIDKIKVDETYIAIPIIHVQMNYFQKNYNLIQPFEYTKHENKKFCLIATSLNEDHKCKIYNLLQSIGECDFISNYAEIIENKSVYHNSQLLNLFNRYMFVFVCENSIIDGYVTEKIFNCYFARTIPIYYGSSKINHYFNKNSFINITQAVQQQQRDDNITGVVSIQSEIINILRNKEIYNNYMTTTQDVANIISECYDDENYKEQLNSFINHNNV